MINERQLTDPSICPSCAAKLTTGSRCPSCGIDLAGELGLRLWTVSTKAAELLRERRNIVETLQTRARASIPVMAGSGAAPPAPAPTAALSQQFDAEANLFPPLPPPVRPESAPRSVQDVLLGLGALLLAIAGVVFVAVSWGSMGIGGRSAILGGFTALVVAVAAVAHRRELCATAEAVGATAVLLALVDAYGLGAMGAVGASGLAYWALATGVVAAASGCGAAILPLTAWRVSAAVLAQVSGWLLAAYLGWRADAPGGAAAVLTFVVAALVLARAVLREVAADARIVATVGQPFAVLAALGLGTWAAYDATAAVSAATLVLVTLILVAVLAARLAEHFAEVFCWSAVAATGVLVVLVRPQDGLVGGAAAAAVAGTVAGALCLLLAVVQAVVRTGRAWLRPAERAGVVVVAAAFLTGSLTVVGEEVLGSLLGPFVWLTSPWTEPSSVASSDVAAVFALASLRPGTPASATAAMVLAAAATAAVAGAALLRRTPLGVAVAVPVMTAALHVELLDLSPTLAVVLAVELALGVLLCVAAALGRPLGSFRGSWAAADLRLVRLVTGVSGLALLTGGSAWSLVTPAVTLVVLPVVIATLAAAGAVLARRSGPHSPAEEASWSFAEIVGAAAAACAATLIGVEVLAAVEWLRGAPTTGGVALAVAAALAMAVSHLSPSGRSSARILSAVPATGVALGFAAFTVASSADGPHARPLTLALSALAVGALAAAAARRGSAREAWAALAVALLVATSAAAASWAGADAATAGLAAVVTAGALLVAGPLVRRPEVPLPATAAVPMELVGGGALALGLTIAALDSDILWIALLSAGAATAVVATRRNRHRVGWVSGVLMVLSTWVRLVDSGVSAPEAYTAPAAVALLIVGWFRRRRDPATGSWTAYGGGLVLLLAPSFLRALADTGGARPLLLGVVALTVLLLGAWRRLQAPLVLGGTVLALHALVQFGPDIVFSTMPKWVSLGSAGLLLLTLGATYERRLAELRRVAGMVSRMD